MRKQHVVATWALICAGMIPGNSAFAAKYPGAQEKVKLVCRVTEVSQKIVKGLGEGILDVYQHGVDHIQPSAIVAVEAGSDYREIRIGESTYQRDDRSVLEYERDRAGNWTFYLESGDSEQGFIIYYNRGSRTGTVAEFSTDQGPSTARVYAWLSCD